MYKKDVIKFYIIVSKCLKMILLFIYLITENILVFAAFSNSARRPNINGVSFCLISLLELGMTGPSRAYIVYTLLGLAIYTVLSYAIGLNDISPILLLPKMAEDTDFRYTYEYIKVLFKKKNVFFYITIIGNLKQILQNKRSYT